MKEKQRVEERAESPLQLIKYNEIQWTQIENDGYDVVSSVNLCGEILKIFN